MIQNLADLTIEPGEEEDNESQFNDLKVYSLRLSSPTKKNDHQLDFTPQIRSPDKSPLKKHPEIPSLNLLPITSAPKLPSNVNDNSSKLKGDIGLALGKLKSSKSKLLLPSPDSNLQNPKGNLNQLKNLKEKISEANSRLSKPKFVNSDLPRPKEVKAQRVKKGSLNSLLFSGFNEPNSDPIHTSRLKENIKKQIYDSKENFRNLSLKAICTQSFPDKSTINDYLARYENTLSNQRSSSSSKRIGSSTNNNNRHSLQSKIRLRQKSQPILCKDENYTLESIPMNKAYRISVENRNKRSTSSWKTVKKWIAVENAQKSTINSIVRFNRNDFFLHKI